MHTVSIIVAERGAEWLSWAHALRGEHSTIVLAQSAVEDDDAFAQRVSDRLRRLESKDMLVEHAAFVGGDRDDVSARVHRSAILRRLSSLLAAGGRRTRLYLDAATRSGQRSLQLMRALGMALADLTHGSGLSIRIGAMPERIAAGAGAR